MGGLWIFFAFGLAFLVAFLSTPFVIRFARRIGAVDIPKDGRRMHSRPIPRLGGLAIFYGFIVSVLCFSGITTELRGILFGSLIIVAVGIADDVLRLGAKIKLPLQTLAAIVVVLHGVLITHLTVPTFISADGYLNFGIFAAPVTVLWILVVTNAVNLIDGLDGLAVGISSIASMSIFFIALIVSEHDIALIAAALAGSCFGFLPYNFNPAKVFMGDTGSTFLGFILSTVSIIGLFKGYAVISFAVPFLVLGLPIFDTGFAVCRRLIGHKPILSPDRGHFHHRLMDMGFTQRQAVGILYLMSSVLGLTAVVLIGSGVVRALVLLAAVILWVLFASMNVSLPSGSKKKDEEVEND